MNNIFAHIIDCGSDYAVQVLSNNLDSFDLITQNIYKYIGDMSYIPCYLPYNELYEYWQPYDCDIITGGYIKNSKFYPIDEIEDFDEFDEADYNELKQIYRNGKLISQEYRWK